MKLLLIDNFDSFTYNLVDYFHQLKIETIVYRNDTSLETIAQSNFDAIVISPGPGKPTDAGITMELIQKYYLIKPILGICLGHQAIGEFFNWKLKKAIQPMHGKVSKIYSHDSNALFHNIANPFNAMRYHSLIIEAPESKTALKAIAFTKENEVMIVIHEQLPIVGIQFHPESILTNKGLQLLQNWVLAIQQK